MSSTREQVGTYVLSKCLALYEVPHAKADPAYAAMCEIYMDQLRPFDPWELQDGMSVLIQRRKSRRWPTVGEISEACGEVRRNRLPPDRRGQKRIEEKKPEREKMDEHDHQRIRYQLQVLCEYQRSGMWGTLAECKAEAARRQGARLTQEEPSHD